MKIKFYSIFSCVIYLTVGVLAEDEIKSGTYPFMAFIYYQDESVLGLGGGRFLQGAVLVRPSFLISSSPESTISSDPLSKTLLARLGSTVIDPKITLNEDEDEQEQEIIQITRPSEYVSSQWWLTDICLLKTLQPITMNKFVHFTQLSTKQEAVDKVCHVLIFKRKSNTDTRVLSRLLVEMLPASEESCGPKFVRDTMRCAADKPSTDGTPLTTDFCRGNNGGPLMCDNDVIALQTYIDNDCKPPHLYQLLLPRKRFLDCGIEEQCGKEHCQHVCTILHKDAPTTSTPTSSETVTAETEQTKTTVYVASSEATTTVKPTMTDKPIVVSTKPELISTLSRALTTASVTTTTRTTSNTRSWPIERDGRKKKDDETDALKRTVSVEAQRRAEEAQIHKKDAVVTPPKGRASTVDINLVIVQSFIYSGLLCVLS